MTDLETLIDYAVIHGENIAGYSTDSLVRRSMRVPWMMKSVPLPRQVNKWTQDDLDYLRQWSGIKSKQEIADYLGRTIDAIHVQQVRRSDVYSPRSDPRWITAHQIAVKMGWDSHKALDILDKGLIKWRELPLEARVRVVDRKVFLQWVVNPENWYIFDITRVRDPHIRRLLELRAAKWKDEWITTGEIARMYGVGHNVVNRAILNGNLPGKRFQNWKVKKSDAMAYGFYGVGQRSVADSWTAKGDAFFILARAVGCPWDMISALAGMKDKRVMFRLKYLTEHHLIEPTIADTGILVDVHNGNYLADWKIYSFKFPRLANAMRKFQAGDKLNYSELMIVRSVMTAWSKFYGLKEIKLPAPNRTKQDYLVRMAEKFRSAGYDLF